MIVTVELEKWKALSISSETDKFKSPLDEWLWFLAAGEDFDTEGAGFVRLRHEIREAVEIMQAFTKSDKARYTYERRLDWERTINAMKSDAQKAGFTEGLKEGLEDARKLKELGVSIDVIANATGLPEIEVAAL